MSYTYAYITGCLILFLFWIFIFLKRKDLRKEMLWAGFAGIPFGFIDFFLVPYYWYPDSLFGLIKKYGVGIESFLFIFLMAGISSVIYEFFWNKKLAKSLRNKKTGFWLIFFIAFIYLFLNFLFPAEAIYNLMASGAIGAALIIYFRKDLRKQIFFSAFSFAIFYFIVFLLVNIIFPGFVYYSYNLKNTWGILILNIPLEEICVAFFAGAFWSEIYDYTKSYREKK